MAKDISLLGDRNFCTGLVPGSCGPHPQIFTVDWDPSCIQLLSEGMIPHQGDIGI